MRCFALLGIWTLLLNSADLVLFRKTLACGDTGDGAMQDWREIVKLIERRMDLTETSEGT